MTALSSLIILASLVAVPLVWLVPRRHSINALALLGALVLLAVSPLSAGWIIGVSVLAPLLMGWADRRGQRGPVAGLIAILVLAAFARAQLATGITWIGGAFFTLRQLHIVGEWWMGGMAVPGVLAHLRYQLFLPAMFVGPVHRFAAFERQCERRRWDLGAFLSGAERVLIGLFSSEVIANAAVRSIQARTAARLLDAPPFLAAWAHSAFDWVILFFNFAGLTAVALGLAAMMGLRLEENFNQPWRATTLLDFWSRWHMSLTNWCRDYVYRPVMALTRSTLAGLAAAMLAIGLWHELSWYYVLWSVWQSLGIVLSRTVLPRIVASPPERVRAFLMPVAILAWLSLARPVITALLELGR